jgi:hypothetical protein
MIARTVRTLHGDPVCVRVTFVQTALREGLVGNIRTDQLIAESWRDKHVVYQDFADRTVDLIVKLNGPDSVRRQSRSRVRCCSFRLVQLHVYCSFGGR